MAKTPRATFPFLSLAGLSIDEALARRLPRRVAYYHLALPLAQDGEPDGPITVVMAQPTNPRVITMLSALLNAEIVPVRGDEGEIRAALDRVFPVDGTTPDESAPGTRILSSGAADITTLAETLIGGAATVLDASTPQESLIALANTGAYDLTVVDMPPAPLIEPLLRQVSTPLWIRRKEIHLPCRILCVVRGSPPDDIMIEWSLRIARPCAASLTLLAAARSEQFRVRSISGLIPPDPASIDMESGGAAHLARLAHQITAHGGIGTLKLCQGDAIAQMVRETAEQEYDVIVSAAEAYGNFIQRMIAALEPNPHSPRSLLVVRPM